MTEIMCTARAATDAVTCVPRTFLLVYIHRAKRLPRYHVAEGDCERLTGQRAKTVGDRSCCVSAFMLAGNFPPYL